MTGGGDVAAHLVDIPEVVQDVRLMPASAGLKVFTQALLVVEEGLVVPAKLVVRLAQCVLDVYREDVVAGLVAYLEGLLAVIDRPVLLTQQNQRLPQGIEGHAQATSVIAQGEVLQGLARVVNRLLVPPFLVKLDREGQEHAGPPSVFTGRGEKPPRI